MAQMTLLQDGKSPCPQHSPHVLRLVAQGGGSQSIPHSSPLFPLEVLAPELQILVLRYLNSSDLVRCALTSRGLGRLASIAAQDKLLAAEDKLFRELHQDSREARRWRYPNLTRLRIEETLSGFAWDPHHQDPSDFSLEATSTGTHIKLEGVGNTAVEFGVVPQCLEKDSKALHKCSSCKDFPQSASRATGFCSAITTGSNLPVHVPLMKGSDIEMLLWPTRVEFIITQPTDGAVEIVWQNNDLTPKPYKGPRQLRFELELAGSEPYKLALTCWAKAHLISAPTRS
ncbi:hypothetical protein DUNSADRAFT_13696 [Dunaliella salina]|uniref:F-box domain-containing protein n=1 Tax=Dunaliella salina TaxID=3046 RepID=A0ABQ7G8Z4_DUNSA|nr:hypothetical protein DUNSADRAFT_13696 [Dunaliella salina]|eukprot:KAF5831027.1 hypothetical protein DUNSADRAFT_13696 [Dunaliella salina]